MPFNIELSLTNPVIKLQVTKNTITVYITGESSIKNLAGMSWAQLETHFINEMSGFNTNWVRGPDAPHLKRNHTSSHEIDVEHFHREFDSEVTPATLRTYLMNLYNQSQRDEYAAPCFQFFKEGAEVETILNAFSEYYKQYKESPLETMFDEEHRLTREEEDEYNNSVQSEKRMEDAARHLRQYFTNQTPSRVFFFFSINADPIEIPQQNNLNI